MPRYALFGLLGLFLSIIIYQLISIGRHRFVFYIRIIYKDAKPNRQLYDRSLYSQKQNDSYLFYNETAIKFIKESLKLGLSQNHLEKPAVKYLGIRTKILANNNHSLDGWEEFCTKINSEHLYEDDESVDELLYEMGVEPIIAATESKHGTQLKLLFTFENEMMALWKPNRLSASIETNENLQYWAEIERHFAEIASFHLDKILGFRKVPPCTERTINLKQIEKLSKHQDKSLYESISYSPSENLCIHGTCDFMCNDYEPVCGNPFHIGMFKRPKYRPNTCTDGSLCVYLPSEDETPRDEQEYPWKNSYSPFHKAEWHTDPDYCANHIRNTPYYNSTYKMLQLIDLAIFDNLIDNRDRHDYEHFSEFGNESMILFLDNGKGFGRTMSDTKELLMPLTSCCLIRLKTLEKLLKFAKDSKLSDVLKASLQKNDLADILTDAHYNMLDRRLYKILQEVANCVERNGVENVVLDL